MKYLTLLLLFILLAAPIQADLIVNKYTNDFALTSPYTQDLKACSCETRSDEYTVKNTGNFISSYDVQVYSNTNFFTPSITQFSLAQGEELTFLVYADPGCTEQQKQEYIVEVKSSFGREQSIKKILDIRKCQNLHFTIQDLGATNIADPIPFTINVRNVADFTDTFKMDFGESRVSFDQSHFTLFPDESLALNGTFYPPVDFSGDYKLQITLSSEKNNLQETKEHIFTIENRYDHVLLLDTQIDVCSRVTSKHNILLQNLYDNSNTYDIQVDGPEFVTSLQDMVSTTALGNKNISLAINPTTGDEGTYTATITATSNYGQIQKTRDVELNVVDCYDFEVSSETLQDTACCGLKEYELTIQNNGLQEQTYNLVSDAPAWFTSEIRTVRLNPNEKTNVKFLANLPCTDQYYQAPIHVVLNSHPELVQTATFEINSQHPLTCHEVKAEIDQIKMDERDSMVPVIISSQGIAAGTYTLEIESRLHDSIQEKEITLAPGESTIIHLHTKTNISEFSDGKYLGHITISKGDLEYITSYWTTFSHTSALSKLWITIKSYNYAAVPLCIWIVLILALITLFMIVWLIFTLIGKRFSFQRGVTEQTLFSMRIVAAALLLVVLISLILIPLPDTNALYQGSINDSSGLVLEWNENEEYVLDLDRYFNDPDGDVLEYTATQPAHISVIIDDSTATLRPELNWAGQENLVFTATDRKGFFVDSPILLLNVKQRAHLSFTQWLTRYCIQVSLFLILLSIIAFLLINLVGITPVVFYPTEHLKKPLGTPKPKTRYVAAQSGSKVHLVTCTIAQRIDKEDEVIFLSKTAAKKEGYTACKRCKPF